MGIKENPGSVATEHGGQKSSPSIAPYSWLSAEIKGGDYYGLLAGDDGEFGVPLNDEWLSRALRVEILDIGPDFVIEQTLTQAQTSGSRLEMERTRMPLRRALPRYWAMDTPPHVGAQIMGAMKEFDMFCRENHLDHSAPSSYRHYQHGSVREVRIEGDRDLTRDDIDQLTGGGVGTFNVACPYCRKKAFKLERPTLGSARWKCFYCDRGGTLNTGQPLDPVKEAEARRVTVALDQKLKAAKTARALELWEQGMPVAGTPVIAYLTARRITGLPPDVHETLRFHPACPYGWSEKRPAMLALFRNIKTNEPCAVHRTWITTNGHKVDRMALGPIGGAAIKLWPAEGDTLVIGEGIETVLAAALHLSRANGEALRPAWAISVARGLRHFPVLKKIRRLVILVDNDENGVGQLAAEICSQRWCDAGREVLKLMPTKIDTDFNDLLKENGR